MNQNQSEQSGAWLSLLEYSFQTGVSLSTLRRQIKSNKIKFRLDDGKYLIWNELSMSTPGFGPLATENEKLKRELLRAQEEITELQMLINIYETETMTETIKDVPQITR